MGYYSDDHGVSYINSYIDTTHSSNLSCEYTPDKGRILISKKSFEAGDIIFREAPLLIVAESANNPSFERLSALQKAENFDYEPLWYWAAMNSLLPSQVNEDSLLSTITEDRQHRLLLLFHDETDIPSTDVEKIIELFKLPVDPILLETLLQVWILNCFEHSEDPLGYSTYFMSSFMSHSCFPCSVWHYDEDYFVLRARRKINVGDEVCCSYLSEDCLLESTATRRAGLEESKHFVCSCERCNGRMDYCRGFSCPGCRVGNVFPLLDEACGFTACDKCSRTITADELKHFLDEEMKLEAQNKEWTKRGTKLGSTRGLEERTVAAALEKVAVYFSQHWQAERLWGQAVEYYEAIGEFEKAVDITRKRVEFFANAYPSLSGAHAWACETLGDQLLKQSDPIGAKAVYENAIGILELMFGKDHAYYQTTHTKWLKAKEVGEEGGFLPVE